MAKFLTTTLTASALENIIKNAKEGLTLISPYLQLSPIMFERLQRADTKGVPITIVFGKDDLKTEVKDMLSQLKNLKLYFYENLHAKCFFNEQHLIITSMNLFAYSEKHNREMGIGISKAGDEKLYTDAVEEAEGIITASKLIAFKNTKAGYSKSFSFAAAEPSVVYAKEKGRREENYGFCIRCHDDELDLNPSRPLCDDCYEVWNIYRNYGYEENYCHNCGKENSTCMAEPLCNKCERQFKKVNNNRM